MIAKSVMESDRIRNGKLANLRLMNFIESDRIKNGKLENLRLMSFMESDSDTV